MSEYLFSLDFRLAFSEQRNAPSTDIFMSISRVHKTLSWGLSIYILNNILQSSCKGKSIKKRWALSQVFSSLLRKTRMK